MGGVGLIAEALVTISFVVREVSFEPAHHRIPLKGQHVRRNAVKEPAVVANHYGAAGKAQQTVFERAERVDVEVVGWFVQEQNVAATAQDLGQLHAVALTTGELSDLLLLV